MLQRKASHDFFGSQFNLPETESKVLAFWSAEGIFEKSVESRKKGRRFVFYEGPPGANGAPALHHVFSRVLKDIIVRYKSLQGYYVPRRAGWDTHGLPVEMTAEKELGITSKNQIEEFGIAAFNKKCQELVFKYKSDWERLTERIGYWVDLEHAYATYKPDYIESLWWIVKQIAAKKFLYQGHKIISWCSRCGTGLSSHELAQGYKEVTDLSVFVRFKLVPGQRLGRFTTDDHTYILSWTTTPWTLPGNVALAVGKDIDYQAVRLHHDHAPNEESKHIPEETVILAQARVTDVLQQPSASGEYWKGSQLVGLEYEPLFDIPALQNDKSHRVYAADFVTTEDGTGVVHTAVMYGEDDYALGKKVGLPQVHTVEPDGTFNDLVPGLTGVPAKSPDTDKKILTHLRHHGLLFRKLAYAHEYPHCWRCSTPILYYARTAWFVAMSKLRKQMLSRNNTVRWVPEHMKQGRFGEWLRDAKDWNFSRERYWGTPLPVWVCDSCGREDVVGSIDELGERMGGARNAYWMMRHGEAETNVRHLVDSSHGEYKLTASGRKEVEHVARLLKDRKIDLIVSSDYHRTKETAHIAAKELGVPIVLYDHRLREFNFGSFSRKSTAAWKEFAQSLATRVTPSELMQARTPHGESWRDLRSRVWHLLEELEATYHGRRILLVSHDYPLWMLQAAAAGWDDEKTLREVGPRLANFIMTGESRPLAYRPMPRNEHGELDLHRPYVDVPTYACVAEPARSRARGKACEGTMRRVPDVIDVWYDSGAMPLAQVHYPFENKNAIDKRTEYPADYIAEGVDQTRGWFYTLMAVATLLGLEAPYKNVIVNGFINDKSGQKMSKSKGNVIEPWEMIEKYGTDALRWYLFAMNDVGDPKNFDETELTKMFRKMHLIFYNALSFYTLYAAPRKSVKAGTRRTLLDRWILARMNETVATVTRSLDNYQIRSATAAVDAFLDDLSRWYIRVSRRRFQRPESAADHAVASETLHTVLQTIAQLLAPFTPFFSEACYHALRSPEDPESVHLTAWPRVPAAQARGPLAADKKLFVDMKLIRDLAAQVLAKRAEAGIRVRQPLASLAVKSKAVLKHKELVELLKAEVNVKEVVAKPSLKESLVLDTTLTPELKEEGMLRELLRSVQELRQKARLNPKDAVRLYVTAPEAVMAIVRKHERQIKKESRAKEVQQKRVATTDAEEALTLERHKVWMGLRKA